MCLVKCFSELHSVKKQVITSFSGCIEKGHFNPSFSCVEMMGLIGAGNNPMVGMTVACAVAVNEALNK